jgi:hypothetical protein
MSVSELTILFLELPQFFHKHIETNRQFNYDIFFFSHLYSESTYYYKIFPDTKQLSSKSKNFFPNGARAPSGPRPPHYRGFAITLRHTHSVGLSWTSDQPVAETSTWQHTTLARDRHSCPRRDSNPQFQQKNGRRTTPQTAQPLGSANIKETQGNIYVVSIVIYCHINNYSG